MSSYIRTAVSIKTYQKKWLKQHPEINFSGFVQKNLDELIETDKLNNKRKYKE